MEDRDYLIQSGGIELIAETKTKGTIDPYIDERVRALSDALVDELVALRKKKRLTQQDVADMIGIPRANISRIERKLYTPTLGLLMKYADSLGKTLQIQMVEK